jgi:hypothetical protein
MGTRADFYVGRCESAEWLGSIAYDGYPGGTPEPLLDAVSEADYRARVEAILVESESATRPDDGWPWPWPDSRTTDFAYAWDGGVFSSCFGHRWLSVEEVRAEADDSSAKVALFPDMTNRTNAAPLGSARSGVLALTVKR